MKSKSNGTKRTKIPKDQLPNQDIRKAMAAKNLTQRDLARAAHYNEGDLSVMFRKSEMPQILKDAWMYYIDQLPDKSKKDKEE